MITSVSSVFLPHLSLSKIILKIYRTSLEIEEKLNYLQDHWLKFSSFFRKVYHTTLDGEKPPDGYECHMDIVKE